MIGRIKAFVLQYALTGSLILSGALALGLAYSRYELSNAKEVIQSLVEWQDGIVDTTRLAIGSDEVTKQTAQAHITQLGIIRIELLNAVETQNTAIDALARESEAARAVAARAEKQREAAIKRAESLRQKLIERAGTPAVDTDAAVRLTQDELYEAGL
jgi:hypothetical protein